jgi:hypothetical protein
MMLQHLDSTKFYRKWSFGSRDSISLRKILIRNESKRVKKLKSINCNKTNLNSFLIGNNFTQSEKYNFINNQSCMITYEGTTYTAENEFVYIKLQTKKSKAV